MSAERARPIRFSQCVTGTESRPKRAVAQVSASKPAESIERMQRIMITSESAIIAYFDQVMQLSKKASVRMPSFP